MGRTAKFARSEISSAALELVARDGPRSATVAAIARRVGAPTGSIYHRFASRELLLAELWMEVVEDFQNTFVSALDGDGTVEDAVRAACSMAVWVRGHMLEARVLLLHRREDFVGDAWPTELVDRAARLKPQLAAALRDHCRKRFGRASLANLRRARFALLDVPYGAIKPYVEAAEPPPPLLEELIEQTVRAVLGRQGG